MKKGDLIDALTESTGESKAAVARVVEGFIELTTKTLKKGEDVSVTGFGTFKASKRPARTGRNPSTGEAMKIAASVGVRFSAGATLKSALNAKKAKK